MVSHEQVSVVVNGFEFYCDEGCAKMVTFFNQLGLKTKHSCQGEVGDSLVKHRKFYIMFDERVTDEQINDFILKVGEWEVKNGHRVINHGGFYKYQRYANQRDKVISNWMYTAWSKRDATFDLLRFQRVFGGK